MECSWVENQCQQTLTNTDDGYEFIVPCDESKCGKIKGFRYNLSDILSKPNEQIPFTWVAIFLVLIVILVVSTLSLFF